MSAPDAPLCRSLDLPDPQATSDLAARLGARLQPGDVLLLEGPIGAGKTHFARSLIQSLLTELEDVPSPTFTLVQVYDTEKGEIWHADLYRLTGPDEAVELGLTEAFETAICLIEWPDRLGDLVPPGATHLTFTATGEESRALTLRLTDPRPDLLEFLRDI
ncbi:tRNA (adenosine(37)-N6)-threonylcarbamoyltransferase complex ATPase subunit type 1 TsaE [Maritimibacter alkaliphilus]|uniref:tRNA (adenosine(37)-N6)-threonylcarbamoyltransferase complex ATPase subunit type 1 TsaE n=1 Tax=Maritimibacter alkaliphilus TaxID=404236 RepID=UPI001C93BEA1|nr:tRNA (adenosine(37)-N6)-threonylcarbamoyltransferase complex ATPase subunit type 1 TsaE [Maritimibacter alkaliphilus]MBY6090502.1 tRNA (adenosine(37)-N6)-threonylcarbamoyltransferase complex ATPase subunit type 1 TsaE [Maritimibacter alkaliphilus]